METDKPRIGTVARLAERAAHLELVPAEAPVPEHDPAEGLVDRVSPEAPESVAVERKTQGPVIGPVPESVQEISVAAIALAVGQVPAARVAEPQRCRRTAALAQIASVIGLSHQAPGSVRVTTLLVGVGLTEPPLDRPVLAEVPASAPVDSATARAEARAVAEDAAAAGGVEDRQTVYQEKPMRTKLDIMTSLKISPIACAIAISCLSGLVLHAAPPAKTDAASRSQPKQKEFDNPKQAADALIQVAANFDVAAAKEILGPDSQDLISSEDPVMDKNRAQAFAAKANEKNSIEIDKKHPNRAILVVGNDNFPLPIPIVKRKGKWSFDTKVGREEILNRRIGANELDAITICRGFVEAQNEYAQEKHDDAKVNQYAQRVISTPDKHDGLAWKNADGTWGGPVGEGVAKALEQGYSLPQGQPQPYHGYYFKVLKGQGPAARMGQMDFVVNGAMIGGFALAAAPAQYRVTGVKTFIVGPSGIVYEKDLGPDTLKVFQGMDRFNPDKSWKPTNDEWPAEESATQ
jgi:hypothetical protein